MFKRKMIDFQYFIRVRWLQTQIIFVFIFIYYFPKKTSHFLIVQHISIFFFFFFFEILVSGDMSAGDKSKKGVKRRRITEDSGETAKRRSARVRNTKCKKEEKVDFQELLVKFLPSRYRTLKLLFPHYFFEGHASFNLIHVIKLFLMKAIEN